MGWRKRDVMTMTFTAEEILAAANEGIYWFVTTENTVYGMANKVPRNPDDTYLLRASKAWLRQWRGDWQALADHINQAINKQEKT
jgi:hypothetical protein